MQNYEINERRVSEIKPLIVNAMKEVGVELTTDQLEKFVLYDAILLHASSFSRITSVTEAGDVAKKHFADSAIAVSAGLIPNGSKLIDVGTGAGFPGIVLKMLRDDIKLTLLDSLKKRCDFLKFCCEELGINAEIIDLRAELAAKEARYRDAFDVATSRAVSAANTLCEWSLPFVKTGGVFIAYKSKEADEELESASACISALGGEMSELIEYETSWGERKLAVVNKIKPTPKMFPRKPGDAKRNPI